jgi:hypothetical protein
MVVIIFPVCVKGKTQTFLILTFLQVWNWFIMLTEEHSEGVLRTGC